MTKQSFHARVWSKLVAFNRKQRLLRPGDRILVAVSGGPDSVCLLHYLHKLSTPLRLRLHVIHFNHGLRGKEADRDAHFVRKLGASLNVPVLSRRLPVLAFARKDRRGLEDAGRRLRYQALAREARRLRCNKVATGHQQDDVAETFLLNLLRGTQAEGLAAIPPRRPISNGITRKKTPAASSTRNEIEVIRPLLGISRRDVLRYLHYHRLKSATDRSNADPRFTRNWVRRKVLPLLERRNPKVREHIARIAANLRRLIAIDTRCAIL